MQKLSKKKYNKIGILGGTFDPPHKGHLYISKIALKKLKLDKLIWVVTKKNPLKKRPYLSLKNRINFMIESCLLDISFHPIADYRDYYNKKTN